MMSVETAYSVDTRNGQRAPKQCPTPFRHRGCRGNGTHVVGSGYTGNPVRIEGRACGKSMMSELPYPGSSLFGIVLD